MYSLPSTSVSREPRASAQYKGTGSFARKGLLTPPASERRALSSMAREVAYLSFNPMRPLLGN